MEYTLQHPQYETSISLKYEIDNKEVKAHFSIYNSSSNCKLAVLENAAGLFSIPLDKRILAINKIKEGISGRNLLITILNETDLKWLQDNFEHYYATTVPCGYGAGNQYHILIKNRNDPRKPIKYVQEGKTLKKAQVLEIINNAFVATINRDKRMKLIEKELCSIE